MTIPERTLSPTQLVEILQGLTALYGKNVYVEPNSVGNLRVGKDGEYIGYICFRDGKFEPAQ